MLQSQRSQAQASAAPAYELYVHDARYTVPTLHLLSTDSEFEARRIAVSRLEEDHHQAVELWFGKRKIAAWARGGSGAA